MLSAPLVESVALPGAAPTCQGKYGLVAGVLRGYPPATSYCAKAYPQRPCTTQVVVPTSTSTVTVFTSTTTTLPTSTIVVTTQTTQTQTADPSTATITATSLGTVTNVALTTTTTATDFATITPDPITITSVVTTVFETVTTAPTTVTETETDTATATVTVTTTSTQPPMAKRSVSASSPTVANAPATPTEDDPTLNAPGGLVERGDSRKAQWELCLKKNPRSAISSICNCLAPKTTITRTLAPKTTITATSVSTVRVTPSTTSTSTAVFTAISRPTVSVTVTATSIQTIQPEQQTLSITVTQTETASTATVVLPGTDTSTVTQTPTITTTSTTTTTTTTTIVQTATVLAAGVNVLKNPGFEDITASGPTGSIIDWPNTGGGRLYPNRFQAAAQSGQTYAILHYAGNQDNPTPIMTQSLTNLATDKPYALSFYYDLHSIVGISSCSLQITLGDAVIYTRTLTTADDPRPYNWKGPETTIPTIPTSSTSTLNFKYECVASGVQSNAYSYIFFDTMSLAYPQA